METFEWEKPIHGWDHRLLFEHDFSLEKLRYGMWKAKLRGSSGGSSDHSTSF